MAEAKVVEKIKDSMKLNSYEAKVYASLLSRGISSAGELADISGVPRSRCYDVLEGLEKKGFVFQKIGKPIKYIAIPPEEAVETLKKDIKREENRLIELFNSIKEEEVFNDLKSLYDTGINYIDNAEISHSILGRQNINLFLKDMLARANKNINIITTKEGVKRKIKLLKKTAKNKLNISIYAPIDNIAAKLPNVKLKKVDKGMRLVNVDDELLFFTSPEDIDPEKECAVWIKSKFTVDAIKTFIV